VGEKVYLHSFLIPTVHELLSFTPFHFITVEKRSPFLQNREMGTKNAQNYFEEHAERRAFWTRAYDRVKTKLTKTTRKQT